MSDLRGVILFLGQPLVVSQLVRTRHLFYCSRADTPRGKLKQKTSRQSCSEDVDVGTAFSRRFPTDARAHGLKSTNRASIRTRAQTPSRLGGGKDRTANRQLAPVYLWHTIVVSRHIISDLASIFAGRCLRHMACLLTHLVLRQRRLSTKST